MDENPNTIAMLAGPVAAGKTTIAMEMAARYGYSVVGTRSIIEASLPQTVITRATLQAAGDHLDQTTSGRWVAEAMLGMVRASKIHGPLVVDAIRRPDQVKAIRLLLSPRSFLVYVFAPEDQLIQRYKTKQSGLQEPETYNDVRRNATEAAIGQLKPIADLVVDTSLFNPSEAAREINTWIDRAIAHS